MTSASSSEQSRGLGQAPSRVPPTGSGIFAEEMTEIIEAVTAFRFAGVQCRLYPEQHGPVQRAAAAAVKAFERAMSGCHFFTLAGDGSDVAVNGQVLTQRDIQGANRDIVTWLESGHLRAVGFLPGVTVDELERFLQVLIGNHARGENAALAAQIADLNLTAISVVPKSVSSEVPLRTALIDFNPAFAMAVAELRLQDQPAVMSPVAAPMVSDRSRELLASLLREPAADPAAPAPSDATPATAAEAPAASPSPRADLSDASAWADLTHEINAAATPERRSLLVVLSHWLRSREPGDIPPAMLERLEGVLAHCLQRETDAGALRTVIVMLEHRMQEKMDAGAWDGTEHYITPVLKRLAGEEEREARTILCGMLDRAGAWAVSQAMLLPADVAAEGFDRMRPLYRLLDERPLRMIIDRLKTSTRMEERFRLLRILREMGQGHVGLLVRELRSENPWYVHRNMLHVLADVGTEEALGAIGEKVRYPDPRVRAMAITAAVEIARQKALPYLAQGLEDEDPDVRARAASLAASCPQPRILQLLIRLVQTSRFGKEEPVPVQFAACTALGLFAAEEAREALLQVLKPPMLSTLRKKSSEVRAAAATALANYLPHPAVTEALQWAARERNPLISQAAVRALGQAPEPAESAPAGNPTPGIPRDR